MFFGKAFMSIVKINLFDEKILQQLFSRTSSQNIDDVWVEKMSPYIPRLIFLK